MPVTERQLAAFADKYAWEIPFDTGPRHLAGPGDARHVTHGLAAAGWSVISDRLSAEIIMRSRDRRHRMQFDPQSTTSAWWRLRAEYTDAEPGWCAEFGELLPAEILAGLTDALVAPAPPVGLEAPLKVLESAGWAIDTPDTALSPDGMCHVERQAGQGDGPAQWHVETCNPGHGTPMGPRIWHAWFNNHVPPHLVSAFVTALADPAPLQRGMFDRTAHYSVVQRPSPLTPQQTVDAHITRIKSLRTQARSARRQMATTAAVPAPTSTARPAARR